MNFLSFNMYAFINHYIAGDHNTTPVDSNFSSTTGTFGRDIDANGWPNVAEANGQTFGGSCGYPGANSFTGPYCFKWDGDGTVHCYFGGAGKWTESNYVAPGSVRFNRGNPNIVWRNSFSAGQIVIFDTTVAGFTQWTKYYVSAASLSSTNIRVADTLAYALAGANTITPNANGSATLYGPYQRFGNGEWTNTQGANGSDMKIIASVSGTTAPEQPGVRVLSTDKYGLGNYVKNIQIYRQADESDLLAGKIFRAGWKQPLVNLNPSAIRFMNWCGGGGTLGACRFENRAIPRTSGVTHGSIDFLSSPAYGDLSGVNQWTLTGVTSGGAVQPTPSNPKLTPASPLHGEIVTCRFPSASSSVRVGQRKINTISNATSAQITVDLFSFINNVTATWSSGTATLMATGHGISIGTVTKLLVAGMTPSGYNGTFTCTVVDANTITYSVSNPGGSGTSGNISMGHGYQVGDKVVHVLGNASVNQGMYRLHYFPCAVQSLVDAFAYTINVDTSAFASYLANHNEDFSCQFLTLAVGGRRAQHVTQPDGVQPEGYQAFGGLLFNFDAPVSFYYDKNQAAETDGTVANFIGSISGTTLTVSGVTGTIKAGQTLGCSIGGVQGGTRIVSQIDATHWTISPSQPKVSARAMFSVGWIHGVWLWGQGGNNVDVPIEICTAMVNEINDMSVAQGISGKVGMWLCAPVRGLMVTDPDYSTASDWGLGTAGVVLSPSSTLRAAGYSNLKHNAPFFYEFGNEIWNINFTSAYVRRQQTLWWPGTSPNNPTDIQAFRSATLMKTIRAAFPTSISQFQAILSGWGDGGAHSQGLVNNYELINGNSTLNRTIDFSPCYSYTTDPYVLANNYGIPMNQHDAFSTATYIDPNPLYCGSNGTDINLGQDYRQPVNFLSGNPGILLYNALPRVGQKVLFANGSSGSLPSNITAGTPYKITSVTGTTSPVTITIATLGGTAITANATVKNQLLAYNGHGTFTDDLAMYSGTDNTANNGGNYTRAANQTQAIANFVNACVIDSINNSSAYSICDLSGNGRVKNFATVVSAVGKTFINYEGGADWNTDLSSSDASTWLNGSYKIKTQAEVNFLYACIKSSQWGAAQVGLFNRVQSLVPGTAMQSVYVNIGVGIHRWAYAFPDAYSGPTEGGALAANGAWAAMATRNQALPN